MASAIISPDEVAKLVPPVVSQARQMTVESVEDYEMAGSFLQLIARRRKQIEEVFDPIVSKAHGTWKEACNQRSKLIEPLEEAKTFVNGKLRSFDMEQDRIRRQEEARLAEIAKKQRDDDAIKEAEALKAAGEHELAEMALQVAAEAPAPVVVLPSSTPKMAEMQSRVSWKWRFRRGEKEALKAFVKLAASNDQLLAYLCFNEQVVSATVRAQKGLTSIPEIEVYSEKDFHGRTA